MFFVEGVDEISPSGGHWISSYEFWVNGPDPIYVPGLKRH